MENFLIYGTSPILAAVASKLNIQFSSRYFYFFLILVTEKAQSRSCLFNLTGLTRGGMSPLCSNFEGRARTNPSLLILPPSLLRARAFPL